MTIRLASVLFAAALPAQVLVRDINTTQGGPPGNTVGSVPQWITRAGNRVLFTANDGSNGRELWSTDGRTASLIDIEPAGSSDPHSLFSNSGTVYLNASQGGTRWMFRSGSLQTPSPPSNAGNFAAKVGSSQVYCTAFAPGAGSELWSADGQYQYADIDPGPGSSGARVVANVGNTLLVAATTPATGFELWAVYAPDSFQALTTAPFAATSLSLPVHAAGDGSVAFFAATDATNGQELWISNGSVLGTRMLTDIRPGAAGSVPQHLCMFQGRCWFVATSGASHRELWSATTAGATRVINLNASDINNLTPAGQYLFFTANVGGSGYELYRTDGTAAGTILLRDILPGSGSGVNGGLTALGVSSRVVFRGQDLSGGQEGWMSDGTPQGTVRVFDLVPGTGSSSPDGFTVLNDLLVFAADDGVHGSELFAMPLAQLGASSLVPMWPGCPGTGGLVPVLDGDGLPFAGNLSFGLRLSNARPSSLAFLLSAFTSAQVPLGNGCVMQVGQPAATFTTMTSAAGIATQALPISTALVGIQIFSQAGVLDPNGALMSQAAISNGLNAVVGLN